MAAKPLVMEQDLWFGARPMFYYYYYYYYRLRVTVTSNASIK